MEVMNGKVMDEKSSSEMDRFMFTPFAKILAILFDTPTAVLVFLRDGSCMYTWKDDYIVHTFDTATASEFTYKRQRGNL